MKTLSCFGCDRILLEQTSLFQTCPIHCLFSRWACEINSMAAWNISKASYNRVCGKIMTTWWRCMKTQGLSMRSSCVIKVCQNPSSTDNNILSWNHKHEPEIYSKEEVVVGIPTANFISKCFKPDPAEQWCQHNSSRGLSFCSEFPTRFKPSKSLTLGNLVASHSDGVHATIPRDRCQRTRWQSGRV